LSLSLSPVAIIVVVVSCGAVARRAIAIVVVSHTKVDNDGNGAVIESSLKLFQYQVTRQRAKYLKPTISNIFPHYATLAASLHLNDHYIVVEADKNLGGCILMQDAYIQWAILDHLRDRSVNKPLTDRQADTLQHKIIYNIESFISKYEPGEQQEIGEITHAEEQVLHESVHRFKFRYDRFCLTIKVHKDTWKTRPVVCCAGTLLNQLTKWLDFWLQKLKPFVPS